MTVSEQIIQVLDSLCEKFGMAIDWTGANVVPYVGTLCMKLVSYEIWTSVAEIALSIILLIIGIVLLKKYGSIIKEEIDDDNFLMIFPVIGLLALFIVSIVMLGININDLIKCLTFPEMYIFEYVKGLIEASK
jgi:hypothetical protein